MHTVACAFNIQAFHHTCPVLPHHKPWLVVHVDDGFWIDHNHPFGMGSASSNSGQIGNGVVDIWDTEDTDANFKYEDDLSQFQIPSACGPFFDGLYHYCHDCDSSLNLIASLHVPWHPTKMGDRFVPIFVFIGFLWDLVLRWVSLPEIKHIKFLYRVDSMLPHVFSSNKVSLLDVQWIHGSLVHVCFVYSDGSSCLPAISNFMLSFNGNDYARQFISNSVATALK